MAETAEEEWLPPGWTIEIKVRKNGRKDRCYTNLSDGSKFNSKPEVLRYLRSQSNRPESEGKRRSTRNSSVQDSPVVAERVNLADSETNGQKSSCQSSVTVGKLKDEIIVESCTGRSDTSADETSASRFKLQGTMDLDQKRKNDLINGGPNSANVSEAPSEMMPEVEKTGNKRLRIGNDKSANKNKKPDLPRRASKRLAGVEVGPIPDLSPNNRTRRVSARQVEETDATAAVSSLDKTKVTCAEDKREVIYEEDKTKVTYAEDRREVVHEEDNKEATDKKHVCPDELPSEVSSIPKEQDLPTEAHKDNNNELATSSVEVPLEDLFMDPCIEFAIKTLTGVIPIEEVLEKNNLPQEEVPEPSTDLPFADLWGDPCIEFAVKTLTGDIPVDDSSIQGFFSKGDKGSDYGLGSSNVSNSDASLTSGFPQNGKGSSLRKSGEDRPRKTVRL